MLLLCCFRLAFDEDRPLNLGDPATVHDIHSVASLLKMYFRELPNPLLTYQLYDKFVVSIFYSLKVISNEKIYMKIS